MGYMLVVIAAVCAAYGTAILVTRTGSHSYRLWYYVAAAALVPGILLLPPVRAALPDPLRLLVTALGATVLLALGVLAVLNVRVMAAAHPSAPRNLDVLIVLGAQVLANGEPSRVLAFRLEAALAYLQKNLRTLAVVSGGQGPNEPCSEADAMAAWLAARGVDPARILREDRSTTTAENLAFSRRVITEAMDAGRLPQPQHADPASPGCTAPAVHVGIVTNTFHLYRALLTAHRQGISPAWGIAAPSTPWRLPHNLLRETLGLVKNRLQGNL